MREVVYSVASSFDGFIAGPEGEHDWIPMDVGIDWEDFMARFDTALIGRRSFEASLEASGVDFLGGMRRYVFSTTLGQEDHPGVTIVSEEAARVVTELRREEGLSIWLFGGGSLFRSLLDAGVVDVVEVAVVPVLLGRGRPLLAETDKRAELSLEKTTRHDAGVVSMRYRC